MAWHVGLVTLVLLAMALGARAGVVRLVLAGGMLSDGDEQVYGRFVNWSGGAAAARICLITGASDDPQGSAVAYTQVLRLYGVVPDPWFVPITQDWRGNASNPAIVARLSTCTGYLWGGGDQSRLIVAFFLGEGAKRTASPALAAIHAQMRSGKPMLGSSAGTASQTALAMLTGGESWEGLAYGPHPYIDPDHDNYLSYDPQGGLGAMPFFFLDTHFSERGRQGRFIRLVSATSPAPPPGCPAESASPLALGHDEDTATAVQYDPSDPYSPLQVEILGASGVHVFAVPRGAGSKRKGAWSIDNVYNSYLTTGDVAVIVPPRPGACVGLVNVTVAKWKTPLAGREAHSSPLHSNDIFSWCDSDPCDNGMRGRKPKGSAPLKASTTEARDVQGRTHPREYTNIAMDLFDCTVAATDGLTYQDDPTFQVRFTKGLLPGGTGAGWVHALDGKPVARALGFEGISPDGRDLTTYLGLNVAIGAY